MYKIVIPIICAFLIFRSLVRFIKRERGYTLLKLLLRLVVWGGLGAITIYPEITFVFSNVLGLQDNLNAVILLGFIVVFVVLFKLLNVIEAQEQTVTKLIREIALKDAKKK
ncbi:DUF2304 domain-containing protein [Candidatus Dojkabacteria bacterium]|nr:DUF2304 domain-containing protein [Candidatus Dojkabacteria bacterium]